jgi:hypothetical protein
MFTVKQLSKLAGVTPRTFGIENPKELLDAFAASSWGRHFPNLPVFLDDFEKRIRLLLIYP